MSKARWAQCALLLVLVGVPLSVRGLQATAYGGWPSLGFAIGLFLAAGPERRRLVAMAETVVISAALTYSYEVAWWQGALGSLSVTVPAMLTYRLLSKRPGGELRLDEVDSIRYHLVTAGSALLCGVMAMGAAATELDWRDSLLAGLMSALAALTAQLVVLPLLIGRSSSKKPAGGRVELFLQRALLVVVAFTVFWPTTGLATTFLVFPTLGWAATRASRRETHVQLFLVCLTAYVLTFNDRGPFAGGLEGLPDALTPALLYLFVAAACYLTVPLTLTVEKLFSMTGQATRAATTVERLLDSASGALIVATDARGRITHYNSGAQQTLGYAPAEVLGMSPSMFHTEREIARQAAHFGVAPDHTAIVLEMVRRGERRDWEFIRKDGGARMASLTLSAVSDPEGKVVGYIGAGEDITDRLRAEEALMTALEREHSSVLRLEEVDHVKQELVSNVSHELRTPITSISGYAELLADGSLGALNEAQVDAVVRIERNTQRLGLLVEDLLTLSRAESGQLDLEHEELDLRSVATEAFEMLEEMLRVRKLEVHVDVPEWPVVVLGDAHALERVVLNLMGNAIKFTPDGGRIRLGVSHADGGAALTVCDSGMGVPLEDQKHLFTRFFRASAATEHAIQGTGLGLSIVHSIVTQHGGTVSVDSTPGSGTTVTVLLPRPQDKTRT